jgi:valyl-tRNA synthetase
LVCQLESLDRFQVGDNIDKPKNAAAVIHDDMQVYVHDVIDIEAERKRLEKQKEQVERAKTSVEAKLANENFVTRAKPQVVEQAKNKLAELTEQLETIEKHIAGL